jgi:hypothetical protein
MAEAKVRATKLRFTFEITKENISYTKEFMESVELRHLDGVKGNFGVSDAEYIAISTTDIKSASLAESKSITRTTSESCPYSTYKIIKCNRLFYNISCSIYIRQYAGKLWYCI